MGTKKYSSYANRQGILKIEKEISYQKVVLGFHRTKA
jgi:hypothetical protein